MERVNVIGAGLAGSEAAWQVARRGIGVRLCEMRPIRMTEAHRSGSFGELVCSNSLRNDTLETAVGLLKEEMRRLGSLVMAVAQEARIPAGTALAVDRQLFSAGLTEALSAHPMVEVERKEATSLPAGVTIIATGPLTSQALSSELDRLIGATRLHFYDAIAPMVTADSIDMDVAFRASRYGKGSDDYINCPLNRTEYEAFVNAILAADKVEPRPFESMDYFEGCMPIEELGRRGLMTLAFGPMRPVGLTDPRTGSRPFAVVQLRQDDREGRLYNMVGFQTKLTHPEQRRVFRMVPGFERAEFVRLGSVHRNTFIDSPRLLRPSLELRQRAGCFIAGQLTGVEGYVESAAAGLLAAINAVRLLRGEEMVVPPPASALGALIAYITGSERRDFQPMHANYGLMPAPESRERGRQKKIQMGMRALAAIDEWIERHALNAEAESPQRTTATSASGQAA